MLMSVAKALATVNKIVSTLLDHTPVVAISAFKYSIKMDKIVMVGD